MIQLPTTSTTETFTVRYNLDLKINKDYPRWKPGDMLGAPLSVDEAVKIAREEIRENLKYKRDLEVYEVRISKVDFDSEHFLYLVTMQYKQISTGEEMTTYDGTVITVPSGAVISREFITVPVYLDEQVPKAYVESKTDYNKSGDGNSE